MNKSMIHVYSAIFFYRCAVVRNILRRTWSK